MSITLTTYFHGNIMRVNRLKIYTDKTLACLQVEIKWSHCLVKQIETPLKHTNKTEEKKSKCYRNVFPTHVSA